MSVVRESSVEVNLDLFLMGGLHTRTHAHTCTHTRSHDILHDHSMTGLADLGGGLYEGGVVGAPSCSVSHLLQLPHLLEDQATAHTHVNDM